MKEAVAILHYRIKRWQLMLKMNYAVYGSDTGKANYGQNIFKPYQTHIKEFGNTTGQGIKNTLQFTELNVSYIINAKANLIVEAGIRNRVHKVESASKNDNYIYFGIKTNFENQYFDLINSQTPN